MAKSRLEEVAEREGKGDKAKTKQAYYRLQREDAEETGNQSLTDKIYKKLGKKSHTTDPEAVNKSILGSVAVGAAIPELKATGATTKMIPGLEKAGSKAISGIESKFPKLAETVRGAFQGKKSSSVMKNVTPKKALKGSKAASIARKNLTTKTPVRSIEASKLPELKKRLESRTAEKALPAGKHTEYEAELKKMSGKKTRPGSAYTASGARKDYKRELAKQSKKR